MIVARHAIHRHSLGALLAVLVLTSLVLAGLAVAPAAAQDRRAVSAQRGQQLIWRYRQYRAEKARMRRALAEGRWVTHRGKPATASLCLVCHIRILNEPRTTHNAENRHERRATG